ncbi:hypothetical protein LINGRAHAP2_LOCUS15115 [Linum grandiflorum]
MGKKDESNVTNRAWNVLRLALISARKGGVLRRRLVMNLRSLKPAASNSSHHQQQLGFYGERQFSFEKTPLFEFKTQHHRPAASLRFILPCFAPSCKADSFDFDLPKECTNDHGEEFEEQSEDQSSSFDSSLEDQDYDDDDDDEEETEGVDSRPDKFIAQFYQQMKLQRQISYLEYNK